MNEEYNNFDSEKGIEEKVGKINIEQEARIVPNKKVIIKKKLQPIRSPQKESEEDEN